MKGAFKASSPRGRRGRVRAIKGSEAHSTRVHRNDIWHTLGIGPYDAHGTRLSTMREQELHQALRKLSEEAETFRGLIPGLDKLQSMDLPGIKAGDNLMDSAIIEIERLRALLHGKGYNWRTGERLPDSRTGRTRARVKPVADVDEEPAPSDPDADLYELSMDAHEELQAPVGRRGRRRQSGATFERIERELTDMIRGIDRVEGRRLSRPIERWNIVRLRNSVSVPDIVRLRCHARVGYVYRMSNPDCTVYYPGGHFFVRMPLEWLSRAGSTTSDRVREKIARNTRQFRRNADWLHIDA